MFAWGERTAGKRPVRAVHLALAAALGLNWVACAHQRATFDQLQTRASFDHACHPWELQVYTIDERTRAVVGCGRRTAYVEHCSVRGSCTWIVDASSVWAPEPAFAFGQTMPVASSAQSSAASGWPPPVDSLSPDEPTDVRLYTRD